MVIHRCYGVVRCCYGYHELMVSFPFGSATCRSPAVRSTCRSSSSSFSMSSRPARTHAHLPRPTRTPYLAFYLYLYPRRSLPSSYRGPTRARTFPPHPTPHTPHAHAHVPTFAFVTVTFTATCRPFAVHYIPTYLPALPAAGSPPTPVTPARVLPLPQFSCNPVPAPGSFLFPHLYPACSSSQPPSSSSSYLPPPWFPAPLPTVQFHGSRTCRSVRVRSPFVLPFPCPTTCRSDLPAFPTFGPTAVPTYRPAHLYLYLPFYL